MRARYKGPAGTGIIEIADDATVQTLLDEIRARTGIVGFTIKYGPPMAMKTLDTSQGDRIARSVGLHGENLTIVPDEARPVSPTNMRDKTSEQSQSQPTHKPSDSPEEVNIPWPEREGTLRKAFSILLTTPTQLS